MAAPAPAPAPPVPPLPPAWPGTIDDPEAAVPIEGGTGEAEGGVIDDGLIEDSPVADSPLADNTVESELPPVDGTIEAGYPNGAAGNGPAPAADPTVEGPVDPNGTAGSEAQGRPADD